MRINRAQIEAFEQAAVRNFEDRMLEHLRSFAPKHFKILTDDQMRDVIRHGQKRAEGHRFTSERSLRIYTELMLILGAGFDADPQMPWAAEMLDDDTLSDEVERIDRLHRKAWDYVEHAVQDYGDVDGEASPERFVEQIRKLRDEREVVLDPSTTSPFYERLVSRLRYAFPNKYEYVGEPCVRRLINRSIESANGYGIATERGVAFFVAVMVVLGSGFDTDPQLPWASAILRDPTITDQRKRIDQLFAAAIDCLTRWWA